MNLVPKPLFLRKISSPRILLSPRLIQIKQTERKRAAVNSISKEDRSIIQKSTVLWFGWSIIYNIYNKQALSSIQNTPLVTASQVGISMLLAYIHWNKNSHLPISILESRIPIAHFILPFCMVGGGQWLGNHFGNMATDAMNYSMVNIIKSSEPIMSMGIMYLLYQQIPNLQKLWYIFPIMFGIVLCNISDLTYTHYGLLLCMASNFFHILKVIACKEFFVKKLQLASSDLFALSTVGSFAISIPVLYNFASYFVSLSFESLFYLLISGAGYYYNSVAAFEVISRVTPVVFSVLNIYKRVFIVASYYFLAFQIPPFMTFLGFLISNIGIYLYL